MISSAIIQREYNRLYREIRRYIWDFQAVEALADLEVAVYQLCPDMQMIRDRFGRLQIYLRDIEIEDEELSKAANRFESLIMEDEEPYARLYQTKEVVQE